MFPTVVVSPLHVLWKVAHSVQMCPRCRLLYLGNDAMESVIIYYIVSLTGASISESTFPGHWFKCVVHRLRWHPKPGSLESHLLEVTWSALKHLLYTLLASLVLMCARGWCNTGRGYVMHKSKASVLHSLDQNCIMILCTLKHLKPAKCVLNITY